MICFEKVTQSGFGEILLLGKLGTLLGREIKGSNIICPFSCCWSSSTSNFPLRCRLPSRSCMLHVAPSWTKFWKINCGQWLGCFGTCKINVRMIFYPMPVKFGVLDSHLTPWGPSRILKKNKNPSNAVCPFIQENLQIVITLGLSIT